MNETRRFLRYVIPGLLFFIELSLYLFMSNQDQFEKWIKEWSGSITFPVTLFLVSGAIGFFLSLVYYAFHRIKYLKSFFGSFLPLIEFCIYMKWIILFNRKDGLPLDSKYLSHSGAWRVVTAYWHERIKSSKKIKSANPRTDSLADIMQGLGSAFMGSILVIGVWIFIHFQLDGCSDQLIVPFVLSIVIIIIHLINFINVRKDLYSVVSIIMIDELKEKHVEGKPIIMYVSHIDINKQKNKTQEELHTVE